MKAFITPATFSPVKLSRVLHAISRAGTLIVNADGGLYGRHSDIGEHTDVARKEITGEQFYQFAGLEALAPVKDLGWKDSTFTYKGLPVLEIATVKGVEDEFTTGVSFAEFNSAEATRQLLALEGQEEKNMTNIESGVQRAKGLDLIMASLFFKLFNLVQTCEMHVDDPNITVDKRAEMLAERNKEAEELRIRSMAQIANNMVPFNIVGCSEMLEVHQSREALRTARLLNLLSIAESKDMTDYTFYFKEENAVRENSYKMTELLDLGMPISI